MSGFILILGTLSALVSVVALLSGGLMIFLSCWGEIIDDKEVNARASALFVVMGCFYLGLALLFGIWVPAPSWIFVLAMVPFLGFLATVMTCFREEEESVSV